MPQAYFLNAAAPQRHLQGGKGPLARGATPRAALGAGCTTRSGVRAWHRHFSDHTVVCSHQTQFDSRPRGEWIFVEVCFSPPRKTRGEWGAVAPEEPRAAAARCHLLGVQLGIKVARGVAPLARGRSPLEDVVAGGGSQEGDTIESVPLLSAPLVTFPAKGK